MTFLRRGVTAIFLATLTVSAFAQSYPTKTIRVVVPFPAGGGTDIIAREVMNKMSTTLGWSFVIDNKPGSGGNLGVDAVAKAAPDGYTIALGQSSNLAINPSLFSKMPYDSVKDLAPISLVASSPMVMVVGADSPFKTLADVVAASKAKPGSLNFATSGNGTVAHLSGEVFQKAAAIKFTHVPYKGAAQATTDLIGGQVQLSMSSVPTLIGHIRSGKMRSIAVTSLTRVDDIPQVPTIAESGYKGFETITWFGFVAPAHTPKDIVSKLNAEINKALQSPDVKKKLSDQGADILGGSPEKFGALIKSDIAYWAPVIKESGAKLD
jgi:tripartite-type tricarboxylate transporter receptor subunit TctC